MLLMLFTIDASYQMNASVQQDRHPALRAINLDEKSENQIIVFMIHKDDA